MPELPEITVYIDALTRHIEGERLEQVRLRSPSLVKTYDPALSAAEGRRVLGLRRIGKRIVWEMEDDLFVAIHLMVTGRLRWRGPRARIPARRAHAAFAFPAGTLLLTEASTHKRASLHVVRGEAALDQFDRGGIEPLEASVQQFEEALLRDNRTLKRALTDPSLFSGIGNAHSDEILLLARLSPVKRTRQLSGEEIARLYRATRRELSEWIDRLRAEAGTAFPDKVTAFHPAMSAHGKFGQPCPACGSPIQRIVYAKRETNYCASCQTEGRLLADRALSRLLKEDWPRRLEELEGD